jgi:hypothetical protein
MFLYLIGCCIAFWGFMYINEKENISISMNLSPTETEMCILLASLSSWLGVLVVVMFLIMNQK